MEDSAICRRLMCDGLLGPADRARRAARQPCRNVVDFGVELGSRHATIDQPEPFSLARAVS